MKDWYLSLTLKQKIEVDELEKEYNNFPLVTMCKYLKASLDGGQVKKCPKTVMTLLSLNNEEEIKENLKYISLNKNNKFYDYLADYQQYALAHIIGFKI